MAYTFLYKGYIFIEGDEPTATRLGTVEYKKGHTFNSQLSSIDVVKEQLLEKTLAMGGNAVIDFKYGQKSSGWLSGLLFSLDDDVKWYGTGTAAILPPETVNRILAKIN